MKALKSLFTLALVASAFVACQKVEDNYTNDSSQPKVVSFTASALDTRTSFGDPTDNKYPTLWTADDQVKISLNYDGSKDAAVTPSSDFKTAKFSVEIVPDEGVESFTFYSVSPSTAAIGFSAQYQSATIEIPASQTPSNKSVANNSQILVANTETFAELPTTVSMNYSHLTAYGRFELLNLDLGTASINSVVLTASKNWAGRYFYYYKDGTLSENSASSTITIETSATENLWFACAPVDLSGGTLKVTVNTTNGPLVKEITLPDNIKFESGVINKFAVDMDGIGFEESKVYTLVTDLSDLTEGSKVIIAAPGDANYAMSTTQNSNNRAQASVTKKDNTIVDPADNVQIFTLEQGTVDNTVAFNTGSGYIYAASSTSNYLRTQGDNDANASFSANIVEGVATLIAQGTNTRNYLRYNASNNPPVFSCYAETSSVQGLVSLYKLEGSGSETPLIVVDNTEYTITVEESENGTVSASAETAKKGTEITLTITPDEGYTLKNLTVLNEDQEVIFSTDDATNSSFVMPASNVTVYAEFKEKGNTPDPVSVNVYSTDATVTGSGATQTATWTSGDITVTAVRNDSGNTAFRSSDSDHTRFYKGWTITVSSAANTIDNVIFTSTNNTYATALAKCTFTKGTAAASESLVTVSGVDASSTAVTLGEQVRISSIKVTYK